jgi:hypothetical protein
MRYTWGESEGEFSRGVAWVSECHCFAYRGLNWIEGKERGGEGRARRERRGGREKVETGAVREGSEGEEKRKECKKCIRRIEGERRGDERCWGCEQENWMDDALIDKKHHR